MRRAIHRQYHGLRVGGDRLGSAGFCGVRRRRMKAVMNMPIIRGGCDGFSARNIRPRMILTRQAFENAATVVAASGGSTNAGLHLRALAAECGISFDLHDVAAIFKRTPYIADLKPGGRYVAKDMYEIGGVPVLLKTLLKGGFIHGDCLTVTGKTMAENLADVKFPQGPRCRASGQCAAFAHRRGGRLAGQSRPEGALVKVAGMQNLVFTGKARCFDCEEDAFAAVEKGNYQEGEVIVIRYEGPKGGPACARC